MNKASIDIGSNSVHLLIVSSQGQILADEPVITELGKNLDVDKKFHPESMLKTKMAFTQFVTIAKKFSILPAEIKACATEASRVADNAISFFESIKSELGIHIEIISGEKEAELMTIGVLSDPLFTNEKKFKIMDMGGASTEIVMAEKNQSLKEITIKVKKSFPMGSRRAAERDYKFSYDVSSFSSLNPDNTTPFIVIAGTMTTIAMMALNINEFNYEKIHGQKISIDSLDEIYRVNSRLNLDELSEKYPFAIKRIATIMPGLKLAIQFIRALNHCEIIISCRGLRHGIIESAYHVV